MLSKRIISEIKSLHQPKFRNQSRLFIVEGEKVVKELLESTFEIKLIAGTATYFNAVDKTNLPDEVYEISEADLSRISSFSSPNKVLAVAKMPDRTDLNIDSGSGPLLALDRLNDPGNLGTIIRTAEWFGIKAILCSENSVDCYNPKVVQGAMGSLFRIPVHYVALPEVMKNLHLEKNFQVIGATLNGLTTFPEVAKNQLVLVLGSESHGISADVQNVLNCEIKIATTSSNKAESLNVAVACGILLHAFTK